jgi:hypothetical protein
MRWHVLYQKYFCDCRSSTISPQPAQPAFIRDVSAGKPYQFSVLPLYEFTHHESVTQTERNMLCTTEGLNSLEASSLQPLLAYRIPTNFFPAND